MQPPTNVDCTLPQPGEPVIRLLTRAEYAATVADLLGVAEPDTDGFPVETSVAGYDNNAGAQLVTGRHVDAYSAAADALLEGLDLNRFVPCSPIESTCARRFIEDFGLRAYRRPLESAEADRLATLFNPSLTNGDFSVGVRLAIKAMLSSPSFLYRAEVGELRGEVRVLTPFEIASALSYLFWGTMPDQALLDAATQGQLQTPAQIETQARRLLNDTRSHDSLAAFFSRWMGTTSLRGTNKDSALFPTFSNEVRESMIEEERQFFLHILFSGTHQWRELYQPGYLMVDSNLRRFYEIDQSGSASFESVPAPAERSGGVLTLGSVLASHAHSNESSPIRRGRFVRERLLCHDLPPPPVNANTTPPGLDPTLTTRERFLRHTAEPSCQGCHQFIDPVGFSFEAFDGVGAYRTVENNLEVDVSGELRGVESLGDGEMRPYEGPVELAEELVQTDAARDCVATQWWRWARGARETSAETCSVRELQRVFDEKNGDLIELMVAVVTQRSFLERRNIQ